MIQGINDIKDFGKIKNFDSNTSVTFDKLNLIYSENAGGKSTISAALRSVSSNSPEFVNERQKLGSSNPPIFELSIKNSKNVRFSNGRWSKPIPEIVVFDDVYISENIYAGLVVSNQQRFNLQELILGKQGVELNQRLVSLEKDIEDYERILKDFDIQIPSDERPGLSVEEFAKLEIDYDPDKKIFNAVDDIAMYHLRKAQFKIPTIPPIELPTIDIIELESILQQKNPNVNSNSDSSKNKQTPSETIRKTINNFNLKHSEDIRVNFLVNSKMFLFSRDYWNMDEQLSKEFFVNYSSIEEMWLQARDLTNSLLAQKLENPSKVITLISHQRKTLEKHNSNCKTLQEFNSAIIKINDITESLNAKSIESNLNILRNRLIQFTVAQSRKTPKISRACEDYLATKTRIQTKEKQIEKIQEKISSLKQEINPKHIDKINSILKKVNTNFEIVPAEDKDHSSANYINYNLQINEHSIPITANGSSQHFKNTLSAGDRNTLAFAFFLAKLEIDGDIEKKIIVFDDPITSMDTNRIHFLQNRIAKLATEASCIIVLSHSKSFLRGIYKFSQELRTKQNKNKSLIQAYELLQSDNNESKFIQWNIGYDNNLSSDFHRKLARIIKFVTNNSSEDRVKVAYDLRLVLEEYCEVYFGIDFLHRRIQSFRNLYDLINSNKIKTKVSLDDNKISQLNELIYYTNPFHHPGRDTLQGDDISDVELSANAKQALDFMNFPYDI